MITAQPKPIYVMKSELPNPALTFIVAKDIQRIFPYTYSSYHTAWQKLKRVKECLGKKKHQGLTVKDFANWEGLDPTDILNELAR